MDEIMMLPDENEPVSRKAYCKPVLTNYENLRTLTLGSSPIGEESGPGGIDFRVPGGGQSGSTGSGYSAPDQSNDVFGG
jgi:hypothetical protein